MGLHTAGQPMAGSGRAAAAVTSGLEDDLAELQTSAGLIWVFGYSASGPVRYCPTAMIPASPPEFPHLIERSLTADVPVCKPRLS